MTYPLQLWQQTPTFGTGVINPTVVVTTEEVKACRSHVAIQELDGDLMANVRVSPLKRVAQQPERIDGWPQLWYIDPSTHWVDDSKKTFVLAMESYVRIDKEDEGCVWMPFMSNYVKNVASKPLDFPTDNGKKYKRTISRYVIELTDDPKVPYVQFMCVPKKVKYNGHCYRQGDIVTIVIRHPDYPLHWPKQPLITVKPTADITYVPMIAKQRLCVVSQAETHNLEYKLSTNSTIKLVGDLPEDVNGAQCTLFNCNKVTSFSEVISLVPKSKKGKSKRIIIPMTEKDPRCPVILGPNQDAVIYSSNIDG